MRIQGICQSHEVEDLHIGAELVGPRARPEGGHCRQGESSGRGLVDSERSHARICLYVDPSRCQPGRRPLGRPPVDGCRLPCPVSGHQHERVRCRRGAVDGPQGEHADKGPRDHHESDQVLPGHRHHRHRCAQGEQRRHQEPGMDVVPSHDRDVGGVEDCRQRQCDQGPPVPGPIVEPSHRSHQREERPDGEGDGRHKQPVGVREVGQVRDARCGSRERRLLGHGRIGDHHAVVGHPEQLVGHRQRERPGHEGHPPRPPPPRPIHNQQDHDEHQGVEPELGPYQRAEAQNDQAPPRYPCIEIASPPDEHGRAASEPKECQARFEAEGGQGPDGRNRGEHQCTQRQEECVRGDSTDKPRRGDHRNRQSGDSARETKIDGDHGKGERRQQCGQCEQVRPQRTGEGFDTLARIEDGTVPGEEVLHHVEVDVAVEEHAPMAPSDDGQHRHG